MGGGRAAPGAGDEDEQDEARRGPSRQAEQYGESRFYLESFWSECGSYQSTSTLSSQAETNNGTKSSASSIQFEALGEGEADSLNINTYVLAKPARNPVLEPRLLLLSTTYLAMESHEQILGAVALLVGALGQVFSIFNTEECK